MFTLSLMIATIAAIGPITGLPIVVEIILAILTPSGLATFITAFYMRRKIKADTTHTETDAVQILTKTSVSLLEPMQQQIDFLNKQLETANKQITQLNEVIKELNIKVDEYKKMHPDDLRNVLE